MSKEMEEKTNQENGVSVEDIPALKNFVENSVLDLGQAMARNSIGETPPIIAEDLKSDETIAEALSGVMVDDPNLKNLDPNTDQGKVIIAAIAIGKAETEKELISDSKAKAKLTDFEKTIAKNISRAVYIGTNVGLTLALAACGIRIGTPTGVLRQGDRGYEVSSIPGLDVLSALGPKSMYTRSDGSGYAGHPLEEGVDAEGNPYTVWTGFSCSGLGCPTTLVVGGPNGLPTSQSCINGYEVRDTTNPNYDSKNPDSKPTVPRYYPTGDNNTCSVLPTTTPGTHR